MIERMVFLKLKERSKRQEVAQALRQVLPGLPGVRSVRVGFPADADAEVWDLAFQVRFDDLEAVAAYVVHPDHVRFVAEVLTPNVEVRKAWNFAYDMGS